MYLTLDSESASAHHDELRRENHRNGEACEVCGLYAEPPSRLCADCEKQFGDEALFMQDDHEPMELTYAA